MTAHDLIDAYPDVGHPSGVGEIPWFRLEVGRLYPDFGHPQGGGRSPWFRLA